jgi:uncharacterized protein (TIGR03437 family)
MKALIATLAFLLCTSVLPGQQQLKYTSVKVYADQAGARYVVDGTTYDQPMTFMWPVGSSHILSVALPGPSLTENQPQNPDGTLNLSCKELLPLLQPGYQVDWFCNRIFTFLGWTDSTGQLQQTTAVAITVVADPSVTSYKASFGLQVRIRLTVGGTLNAAQPSQQACGAPYPPPQPDLNYPGVVVVNGQCYWNSQDLWIPVGTVLTLNAFPYYGYAFTGWTANGGLGVTSLLTYTVQAPLSLIANFEPGKAVRFYTDPPNLSVLIDRTRVLTLPPGGAEDVFPNSYPIPGLFFWRDASKHLLAAESPQSDRNAKTWVFDSFSNGMGLNSVYTTKDISVPEAITAKFLPAAAVDIFAQPAGLKVSVDGRDNWLSHVFTWGLGSKHQISAPLEQADAQGRKYRFKSWSNSGPAAQEIVMDQGALDGSLRLVATYELLSRVVLNTTPAGIPLQVDGAACATPCVLDRAAGETARASAAASIAVSSVERQDFGAWSDGSQADRTIAFQGADPVTLTARYQRSFFLQASAEPDKGAALRSDPASTDSFYPADTQLAVVADLKPGYKLVRWEGDVSGASKSVALKMDGPKTARAILQAVPYVADGGVRNAAGDTPDLVVAPGSLIAIFGSQLAPDYVVGPASPLAQTIAGVTVQVADRFLPLLFVSPEQINAQLPSDLEEGDYSIAVRSGTNPAIGGRFTAARNAPGLFSQTVDSQTFAVASHEDGSQITPGNPARKGEVISLLGTGFGPYQKRPPDGFAVPGAPPYPLADTVELWGGDQKIDTIWAGAAPGYVGITVTRFKLPVGAAPGAPLDLKVRINGRESNKVQLPVE